MARIFSTTFTYQQQSYTAIISQTDSSLSIYIPDASLHTILPDGKASLNLQQGIEISPRKFAPAQDLLTSIMCAIEMQKNEKPGNQKL